KANPSAYVTGLDDRGEPIVENVNHTCFDTQERQALDALIVIGGAVLNLVAGLAFAARPLRLRPAGVLRTQAG
ncbi:MAG: hypothetical protein AAFR44_03925, partial [Pseudomonadota bacterium]